MGLNRNSPLFAVIVCAVALRLGIAATMWERKLKGEQRVEHALNRLAFGPRPGDLERVKKLGLERWIEDQLKPADGAVSTELAERLERLDSVRMPMGEMVAKYPPRQLIKALGKTTGRPMPPPEPTSEQQAASRRDAMAKRAPQLVVTADLIENKLYRAIYSDRQLDEVLVDFWFNHFNVFLNKGPVRHLATAYERDAIRPYVFGKFSDMLRATAEHPAMLVYLDNWQSVDPSATEVPRQRAKRAGLQAPRRARGLNENYGRELLELHTLGVDGGYSQKDVVEVARCFTGWTVGNVLRDPHFQFVNRLHDKGEKVVLGHSIPAGGGMEDGLRVIEILASHPSTAKFVSWKLAQRFVADQPPQPLVDRMAATFARTGGDLREVMKTMIHSREFFSEGAYRAKMKSPFEMVVSAVRKVNADVISALALSRSLDEMGQPLYRKEEPLGYGNTADDWVSTAGLLARVNFSLALTNNKLRGVKVDTARLQPNEGVALGSPEFQRH